MEQSTIYALERASKLAMLRPFPVSETLNYLHDFLRHLNYEPVFVPGEFVSCCLGGSREKGSLIFAVELPPAPVNVYLMDHEIDLAYIVSILLALAEAVQRNAIALSKCISIVFLSDHKKVCLNTPVFPASAQQLIIIDTHAHQSHMEILYDTSAPCFDERTTKDLLALADANHLPCSVNIHNATPFGDEHSLLWKNIDLPQVYICLGHEFNQINAFSDIRNLLLLLKAYIETDMDYFAYPEELHVLFSPGAYRIIKF